jgi:hypothetical protein
MGLDFISDDEFIDERYKLVELGDKSYLIRSGHVHVVDKVTSSGYRVHTSSGEEAERVRSFNRSRSARVSAVNSKSRRGAYMARLR